MADQPAKSKKTKPEIKAPSVPKVSPGDQRRAERRALQEEAAAVNALRRSRGLPTTYEANRAARKAARADDPAVQQRRRGLEAERAATLAKAAKVESKEEQTKRLAKAKVQAGLASEGISRVHGA